MEKGISLYPGLDTSAEKNLMLLTRAAAQGITRLFTSLHIPESDTSQLGHDLKVMLKRARELHMDVISDISPQTCAILGVEKLSPTQFLELGITTIRCDYGFSPEKIALFSKLMAVQLNASTIKDADLIALKTAKAEFSHIDALHNFYPRPHTGLGEEFFRQQNRRLHENGISVGAFIPSQAGRRGPLYEGLPTLEDHRTLDVSLTGRHLAALGVDSIFIGDSQPTDQELDDLRRIEKGVVTIKARLLNREPFIRDFLSHTFTARPDQARDAIRAQESRALLGNHKITEDSTWGMGKRCGDITLDNLGYGRYMGELQIITASYIPADARTNTVARILPEEHFLLPYIKPGRKFRFEFVR